MLKGADSSGAVAIAEVATDWNDRNSVINGSRLSQKVNRDSFLGNE